MDTCAEDLFNIGGYVLTEANWALGAILTFAGNDGRQCQVEVADAIAAFLALDRDGLIPEIDQEWKRGFGNALAEHSASQGAELVRYGGLELVTGGICECCGAECHAVFKREGALFLIERWSIVIAIMALIHQGQLPRLSFDWHISLERHYERICETGRYHYRPRAGGPQHV